MRSKTRSKRNLVRFTPFPCQRWHGKRIEIFCGYLLKDIKTDVDLPDDFRTSSTLKMLLKKLCYILIEIEVDMFYCERL